MGDTEPETIHASRARLAVRFLALVGALAAVWGVAYAWGGPALWTLAAVGLGLRAAALALALVAATLVWLVVAARIFYDFAFPHRLVLGGEAARLVRADP